jgi:regulator of sigma E protease
VDGVHGDPVRLSRELVEHRCAEDPPVDGCEATTPAALTIVRDGETHQAWVTPVYDEDLGQMLVGFQRAESARKPQPFGRSVNLALDRFWYVAARTVQIPLYVLDPERRDEISGVVGAYEVTRQYIVDDVEEGVAILALISLSLAIINLFPFLPLDGGHIFWAAVEKVRRKPVSYATMERAGVVGIMLLIPLVLIGLTNDLGRIFGEGFGVP